MDSKEADAASNKKTDSGLGAAWIAFMGVALTAAFTFAGIVYSTSHKDSSATATPPKTPSRVPTATFNPDNPYPINTGPLQIGMKKSQVLSLVSNGVKISDLELDFSTPSAKYVSRVACYFDDSGFVTSLFYYFPSELLHEVRGEADLSLGTGKSAPGQDAPALWVFDKTAVRLEADSGESGDLLITAN